VRSSFRSRSADLSALRFNCNALRRFPRACAVAGLFLLPAAGLAANGADRSDPIAPVILGVTWIVSMAILGRFLSRRVGQPAVVGELLMGIFVGNVGYFFGGELVTLLREVPQVFDVMAGVAPASRFDAKTAAELNRVLNGSDGGVLLQVAHSVDVFSRYGVIFLLFLVGLESSVEELRAVGAQSARVAFIGVTVPFVLGVGVMQLMLPDLPNDNTMFVAATLVATSVGITARVLQELGKEHSREGRIILGAAVMDDILGLLMLAVATSGAIYTQILLGAVMRHTGAGLAIPDFPWVFGGVVPPSFDFAIGIHYSHRIGALVVISLVVMTLIRVITLSERPKSMLLPALSMMVIALVQATLGALVVITGKAVLPNTLHVGTGALLLAASLVLTLVSCRSHWLSNRKSVAPGSSLIEGLEPERVAL